jgi:hypothetical protein
MPRGLVEVAVKGTSHFRSLSLFIFIDCGTVVADNWSPNALRIPLAQSRSSSRSRAMPNFGLPRVKAWSCFTSNQV